MQIRRLTVGPFQSNCYVVGPSTDDRVIVIDPGADGESILAAVEDAGGTVAAILLTHAHLDHIGAVAELKAVHDAPVYLHPADLPLYERAEAQAAAFGLTVDPPPPPDAELQHGQRLSFGDLTFEVRHAPGHSPGGVVLVDDRVTFVGDCVFSGSIGRTDLPGGDMSTLLRSIREQILTLAPEMILCSGHGPETTVERETVANPFLNGSFQWEG
jgi:glyoxylase-like metal-dependent hydrolase (beta-lactamase superfamily II)